MSIGFIAAQSIYATKTSRKRSKSRGKKAMTMRGGVKKPMDIVTTRLLNGATKKRMHYQASPMSYVTTVTGARVVVGNEKTYPESVKLHLKWEKEHPAPKKEAGTFPARETCKRLESKQSEPTFDKFGFQKQQGRNGRRVQKHGSNTVFK